MSHTLFSQKEIEYFMSQQLARVATASTSSEEKSFLQPDVVPVSFDFDGEFFYIRGTSILKSIIYKNVLKNDKVAIVIDDLGGVDPPNPRGIRIYGNANIVSRQGGYMDQNLQHHYIRISPKKKWSWGIEELMFANGRFNVRRATKKS
jgi:pyridoxamine 5'-phosphate oxidase family protein